MHRRAAFFASGRPLSQYFLEYRGDGLRVSLAAKGAHGLADQVLQRLLLAGAVLTFTPWKEYANYVLIAGLFIIVIRGSIKARENLRDKDQQKEQ